LLAREKHAKENAMRKLPVTLTSNLDARPVRNFTHILLILNGGRLYNMLQQLFSVTRDLCGHKTVVQRF
jgi:hypothetical protein